MQIQLEISDEVASQFSEQPGGVYRAALEALALEWIRSGRLTEHQARIMLGIETGYEMDGFLKEHNIFLSDSLDSVVRDSEAARSFLRG